MNLKKEITSFEKIAKLQRLQLNEERNKLEIIRKNLEKIDQELKKIQDAYWLHIDSINQQRLNGEFRHIKAGQSASNFYREKFLEVMTFRKKIEAKFESQQSLVSDNFKKLSFTEKLIEGKIKNLQKLLEEKDLEEIAEQNMHVYNRLRSDR